MVCPVRDVVWFNSATYGWLGVTPAGGLWSANEGQFLSARPRLENLRYGTLESLRYASQLMSLRQPSQARPVATC